MSSGRRDALGAPPAALHAVLLRPLLSLAVAAVLGVLLDRLVRPPWVLSLAAGSCLWAAAVLVWLRSQRVVPSTALALLACLGLFAAAQGHAERAPLPPEHVAAWAGRPLALLATVVDGPQRGAEGRERYLLDVSWLRPGADQAWQASAGRVSLTVAAAPDPLPLPGDLVLLQGGPRQPRGFANPGCADFAALAAARGAKATLFLERPEGLVILRPGRGPWRALAALRRRVGTWLDGQLPAGPARELLRALALGEPGGLDPAVRRNMAATGTAHLLALSGLHLGVVAALCHGLLLLLLRRSGWLLRRWDLGRAAAGLTLLAVAGYTVFTGAALPTLRAALMVAVYLGARVLGRQRDVASAYCFALLVLLLRHPPSLFDPSFQLSFAAVAAVLLLSPRLLQLIPGGLRPRAAGRLARVGHWLAQAFAVSLAASLGTWPVIAWHFHQFAPIAPLANLAVVPLVSFGVLPLAMAAAALSGLWPALAGALAWLGAALAQITLSVAAFLARLPGAGLGVDPPRPAVLFAYCLLLAAVLWPRRRGALRLASAGVLGLALALALPPLLRPLDGSLHLRFLDVGQGDATLLRLPGPAHLLVDTGGLDSLQGRASRLAEDALLPHLRAAGVGALDALVLTHPHPDHYGAAAGVLAALPVREVWVPSGDDSDGGEAWREFVEREVRPRGIPLRSLDRTSPELRYGALRLRVLHPPPGGGGLRGNDRSLVLSLRLGGTGVLLAGDVERAAEAEILQAWAPERLRHAVLKVPHHGSRSSSSPEFLRAVAPREAFFPVGLDNRWGFPHAEVWGRYAAAGCRRWRADRTGSLAVEVDEEGRLWREPYVPAGWLGLPGVRAR